MNYERLTVRFNQIIEMKKCDRWNNCTTCSDFKECPKIQDAIDRLAELEDMLEDGRMVELPCGKPCEKGDKYYIIDVKRQKIFEGEINYVNYDKTYGYICQFSWKDRDYMVPANLELLGTSFYEQLKYYHMYKTQAEAEEKLQELRGEKD